jgi:hypothetical protein
VTGAKGVLTKEQAWALFAGAQIFTIPKEQTRMSMEIFF